ISLYESFRFAISDALRCLSCSYTSGDDDACIQNPSQVPYNVSECFGSDGECCTITRQEFTERPGIVVSFARVCMKTKCPKDEFQKVEDPISRVYLTFCDEPLCNVGLGDKPLSNGNGKDNFICCIKGSGSEHTSRISLATTLSVLLILAKLI
ncbi:hypothetical protein SK128_010138, partial [Halocaridina rubra]